MVPRGLVWLSLLGCAACPPAPEASAPPAEVARVELLPVQEVPPNEPPVTAAAPAVASVGGQWSTFHGDAGRTGATSAPAITKPTIAWKSKVGIQSWLNGPVVASGVVYVPSCGTKHDRSDEGDGVRALDLATGKVKWTTPFSNDANGIAFADGRVFATSDDGNLYAMDAATGKVSWKQKGARKMYAHPLVLGKTVVVADASGVVRAFSVADGRSAWTASLQGTIRGGPAADDDRIYVATVEGEVAALSFTGRTIWKKAVSRPDFDGKRSVPISVYAAPLVAGDRLLVPFVRDTYYPVPALVALDKKTGEVAWRASDTTKASWGNIRSTPALARGLAVYGEPYSGDVVAVSAKTGTLAWRKTVGPCYFPQWASPAIATTTVYQPRFDGTVYALDLDTGSLLWSVFLGSAAAAAPGGPARASTSCEWEPPSGTFALFSPAAVAPDGTLLVGSNEGFLYAIRDRLSK